MSSARTMIAGMAGFWLLGLCIAGYAGLWLLNRRDQQIRLLLGRHRLGVSDPVTWTDDLLALIAPAKTWFGAATFAEACDALLAEKKVSQAMWAARLCAALEDDDKGRGFTDRVLSDTEARAELARLRAAKGRQPVRPWPIVRKAEGADAQFWYGHLFDAQTETQEDVQYAGHIGGQLAYIFDPDDPEEEKEWMRNPGPERTGRSGPHARAYFFGGLGIVAAVCLSTYMFVKVFALFLPPTLADQMVEQQRRQAQQ